MPSQIPPTIQGQKYISLTTLRKTGAGVATPVWFGEEDGKLYVMTRSDMGKTKRIRNNPQVRVAPCTMRGTVTGAEFAATARILRLPTAGLWLLRSELPGDLRRRKAAVYPSVAHGESKEILGAGREP